MTTNNPGTGARTDAGAGYQQATPGHAPARRSTETKMSTKTTELIVYVVAVIAVVITALVVGGDDKGSPDPVRCRRGPALHHVVDNRLHDRPWPGQVRQPRELRRLLAARPRGPAFRGPAGCTADQPNQAVSCCGHAPGEHHQH